MTLTPPTITPPKLTPDELATIRWTAEVCSMSTEHPMVTLTKGQMDDFARDIESALNAKWLEMLAGQDAVAQGEPIDAIAELLHHPFTPRSDEFSDLFLSLCERPLTIREIARRCWKAASAQPAPVPAQAPALLDAAQQEIARLRSENAALNERLDAQAPAVAVPDVRRVALSIIENMEDRRGILDGVDDDVKQEMLDTFAKIIGESLTAAQAGEGGV